MRDLFDGASRRGEASSAVMIAIVHTSSNSEDLTNEPGKVELSMRTSGWLLAMPQRAPKRSCRYSRRATLATGGLV